MNYILRFILLTAVCLCFFVNPVHASDDELGVIYSADEFDVESILDSLPQDVRERLPNGDVFDSGNFSNMFSAEYFFGLISLILKPLLPQMLKTVAFTLGIILISSALGALKGILNCAPLSSLLEFLSGLCIMLTLYGSISSLVESVRIYLGQLTFVIGAMVPVTVSIGIAGGNVSASTVSANAMMLGVAFIETVAASGLFPVLQLCFGLSAASGMGGGLRLNAISKLVRGVFTGILAFISAVISAVMTFQNSIAVHADSLSMRALKFAASNAVPVAGGIAGDAVSAVAGSLSLIKSTVGWVGIIIICIMTLPVIFNIILTRLGIAAARTAADILGADGERTLLDEMCGLLGFLTAVCVIASLMFVYALTIFSSTASALAV